MIRAAKFVLGVAVLAALLVPALSAHAAGGERIATLTASATALVWQPAVAHDRTTLRVSGPDGVVTREFDAATMPSLDLFGADGYPLADGGYQWELVVAPALSGKVRDELARARQTGDESRVADLRRSGELPEPSVVSGHFRVHQGAFVQDADEAAGVAGDAGAPISTSGAVRNITAADQVIPDDLIVQGSLCVGFDCVNNEPFGFDTIRLKENNLRILFMDTSVGTFPTRDWQLVANDSASGGASKFSIEDIDGARVPFTITAGAATNSIFVDSTGRMGLRTSTPVLDLHINTSNTPAIRLEQNNSGGFAAQTWDVAGNEANFFVRDVTGGSRLSFRVRPGAPTSSVDISSDGDVGVGTGSPDAPLHVLRSNATAKMVVEETNGTVAQRALLELINNGDVFFRQTNSSSGQFVDVNLIGNEFRVNFGTGGAGPELRLDNNGNLFITGTYTPDYVFESDYPLLPLDELAAFIDENKHLPNIPSDAEVKATRSVNVNEFQMRLLEKVEELTLYTLQQHDTIKTQQAGLAELQAQVAALKAATSAD